MKLYKLETGDLVATLVGAGDGEWVALTPEGFFDDSRNGKKLFNVFWGAKLVSLDDLEYKLHRSDLVREKLAGDPQGKVKAAAANLTFN